MRMACTIEEEEDEGAVGGVGMKEADEGVMIAGAVVEKGVVMVEEEVMVEKEVDGKGDSLTLVRDFSNVGKTNIKNARGAFQYISSSNSCTNALGIKILRESSTIRYCSKPRITHFFSCCRTSHRSLASSPRSLEGELSSLLQVHSASPDLQACLSHSSEHFQATCKVTRACLSSVLQVSSKS